MNTKNPLIAAILNIIPGLGYIYIGNKKLFGFLLLVSIILLTLSTFDPNLNVYSEEVASAPINIWFALGAIGQIMFTGALVFDGYKNALEFNTRSTNRRKK